MKMKEIILKSKLFNRHCYNGS
ncbi:hypothetical protein THIX_30268 [Thiomonas sp. X19]|nr:hypothetical protein THIX_30268 [Thiomonas sp. X19]